MLKKDTAICIRAIDYSETSQIVTLFTRLSGKIDAIAKGSKRARSAFDGPIEIFSTGRIVFTDTQGEKLSTLTEFQQHSFPAGLARNLFSLNAASFAAELVTNLTDPLDPHPDLFDSLMQFLKNLSQPQNRQAAMTRLILFQLSLLSEIGLKPVLSNCVNCKNNFNNSQHHTYFSSSANGLICRDCETSFPDKIKLTAQTANCLTNLKTIAKAAEQTLNEIERILIYHFTEIMHKPPKMAKYILP